MAVSYYVLSIVTFFSIILQMNFGFVFCRRTRSNSSELSNAYFVFGFFLCFMDVFVVVFKCKASGGLCISVRNIKPELGKPVLVSGAPIWFYWLGACGARKSALIECGPAFLT
ncbi:hypothetical protein RvY_14849 [Ramazzottius varieornatus]|uniref:Uncharacterized protein n=1 Tax=Ramazzottius varieornatus TaxID=947166 RepID=A0A1D1VSR1_RAMVA|nr:hypothetical protein RvY_14849 [Ramazzottius varieornatus]